MRSLRLLGALLVLATACGGSGAGSDGVRTITIANSEFAPETLQVNVGDRITVRNKDGFEHTLTATDGSFDTGAFDGTKRFTVARAGRFEYQCLIHPFMTHRFIVVR